MTPAIGFAGGSTATTDPLPDGPVVLAVDIGGTKMAAAVVDDAGTLLSRARTPTPHDLSAEVVFEALASVVDQALAGTHARPVADRVKLPIRVDNDAKALALGEGWLGAAAGCQDFLAMVVSTGVGAGIVLDGRLLDGAQGNAGHIGHIIVEPDGRRCPCGAQGCLEAETSGTAIEAVTGQPAAQADEVVRRRTGTLVGRAVASVANLLDLRLAVVAGSVALGFGQPFFEAAQAELDARARIGFARGARIVPGGLGSDGPLVGAAALGRRALDLVIQ